MAGAKSFQTTEMRIASMPDHSNDPGNAGRAVIDRLHCPSCQVAFAIPKELDKFKGKRTKCQACGTPLRFSADGLGLTIVDEISSSNLAPVSASSDCVPAAESANPGGLPGDSLHDIKLGEDQPRRVEPTSERSRCPWRSGSGSGSRVSPSSP